MLHQKPSGGLARLKYLAALPVCAALLCASTLAFSKTYGWIDLVPKPKNDTTYRNKTAHDNKYTNINEFTNTKGYKIQEKTTLDNGNFSRTATITDKNGNTHVYDSEKTTPAERKMLSETYGYEFPKKKVFNITLSPPPAPSIVPPVPAIKPKRSHTKSIPPMAAIPAVPPVSAVPPVPPVSKEFQIKVSPVPATPATNDTIKIAPKKDKIGYQQSKELKEPSSITVGGKKYDLKEKRITGQTIIYAAPDSIHTYPKGTIKIQEIPGEKGKFRVAFVLEKITSIEAK